MSVSAAPSVVSVAAASAAQASTPVTTPIATPDLRQASTARMEAALAAFRAGQPVLLLDDLDRENEADIILPADTLTTAQMAQMIRECSGIVCLCLTGPDAARLGLKPMVEHNRSRHTTAFTASIEAASGVSTGVSARDRVTTIQAALSDAGASAIVSPGHVFPLIARPGGVLERRGHTEGSVDLARLAGHRPAAVLCELMNPDGSMAVGDQVLAFAAREGMPLLTIADIAAWRENEDEGN